MQTHPQLIQDFWNEFKKAHPNVSAQNFDVWYFGSNQEQAIALAQLVLERTKTATAMLYWDAELDTSQMPKPKGYSVVTDFHSRPICVLQTQEFSVVPFNQVTADFAYEGGEDDRTLQSWREGYWRYIRNRCEILKREPSEEIPMICERFRLVWSPRTEIT